MINNILKSTSHREYPLPKGPWIMMQEWEHLLFMHWPVSPHKLKPYLPPGLELDTYDGDAWISIIPFQVSNVRLRKIPPIPFFRPFLEINVRTYVKRNGVRGVYFFGLDANKLLAVLGARMATLPYFYSKMSMAKINGSFYYDSARSGRNSAIFQASYQPIGDPYYPEKKSLSSWLLERYFLWSYKYGALFRGGIHHRKWELQDARVNLKEQSLTSFLPSDLLETAPSLVHYATSKTALNWMIRKEGTDS